MLLIKFEKVMNYNMGMVVRFIPWVVLFLSKLQQRWPKER